MPTTMRRIVSQLNQGFPGVGGALVVGVDCVIVGISDSHHAAPYSEPDGDEVDGKSSPEFCMASPPANQFRPTLAAACSINVMNVLSAARPAA